MNPFDLVGIGSLLTGAAGVVGATSNNGMPNVKSTYTNGPDFTQGQTATNDWLNQLTSDQQDPTGNFGAISPDWNDMWAQTQKQVQQYYDGTPTSPGVNDQVKASFAQRGMSGDPAASYLQSASGANEASDLSGLSAQENIAKQTFAQQGKQNWLNSISGFQNQVANGPTGGTWNTVTAPTPTQQIAEGVGAAGSGIASYGLQQNSQNNQLAYLNNILNPNPTTFAPSSGPSNTAPYKPPTWF